MEEITARKPKWVIKYQGVDVTPDLSVYAPTVTYTDQIHGLSDEIEVELEDSQAKFRDPWYPTKGDVIELFIGYEGERLMPCGQFCLDQVRGSGPPFVVCFHGIAAEMTADLRTLRSKAYESTSLEAIAEQVAKAHGYELVGDVAAVAIKRITQNQERDLSFLKRVAADYGHAFKVVGKKLVFVRKSELAKASPARTIDRTEMSAWNIMDKLMETFKACEVSYHDPKTKKLITRTVSAEGAKSGDTLKRTVRCESAAQAEAKAKAMLNEYNAKECDGNVIIEGDPTMVAGNTVKLTGLGKMSGAYLIKASRHRIDRSGGYTTDLEVMRGVGVWAG